MAYIVMAYIFMAYICIACIGIAYIVMAYVVMALCMYCLYRYRLYSYHLYRRGLYVYDMFRYGLCSYGLCSCGTADDPRFDGTQAVGAAVNLDVPLPRIIRMYPKITPYIATQARHSHAWQTRRDQHGCASLHHTPSHPTTQQNRTDIVKTQPDIAQHIAMQHGATQRNTRAHARLHARMHARLHTHTSAHTT